MLLTISQLCKWNKLVSPFADLRYDYDADFAEDFSTIRSDFTPKAVHELREIKEEAKKLAESNEKKGKKEEAA